MTVRNPIISLILLGALAAGCSTGPKAIVAGLDQCTHCKMAIFDLRFAAQYVSDKGKIYTFDSIECLVHAMHEDGVEVRSAWVADYEMSDAWVPVEQAVFLYSDRIHSPMGAGLAAFGPPATPSEIRQAYEGTVVTWSEAKDRILTAPHGMEPPVAASLGD